MKASRFFTDTEKKKLLQAIQTAEKNTSGEIVLHIENHCDGDVMERAKEVFDDLQIYLTEQKNGVLIYLAITDKKFAILGDEGIDQATPPDFWSSIRNAMQICFANGEFTKGLLQGIDTIGQKLKAYFPFQSDDINELSDNISFYDN